MNDLSRSATPPGGWQFYQPQTGWRAPTPIASTFNQTVQLIIKHRLANPAITRKHSLATTVQQVETELENFTRARLKLPPAAIPKLDPRLPMSQVAGGAAVIKRAAQGTAVVMDWLLSGGPPVEKELAVKRAETCVTCTKNVKGEWFTTAPAEIIRATLSARSDLKLETPVDHQLRSCDVCKCLMRLKVWTPLSFIMEKTKPEILAEFPSHCWITKRDQ